MGTETGARVRREGLVGEMAAGRRPKGQSKRAWAGMCVRQGQGQDGVLLSERACQGMEQIFKAPMLGE